MRLLCFKNLQPLPIPRSILIASMSSSSAKKVIQIDVVADTVCPWCFVGKQNLDKAIASSNDKYSFEIKWHPYMLNPNAPTEGVVKKDYYLNRFGPRSIQMESRMSEIFKGFGLDFDMSGLTGNTLDSHRLIYFAGTQSLDKQHKLVEELSLGYFTQGKYIGDREFLVETAKKVGVEGAAEFLQDPSNGLKEVNEDLKRYAPQISGVPHFTINGKSQLSGGQPPESFLRAFQAAA
ncbi:Thioredoxin superfamily protein [Perilla frutescens var. hirtella]|nr:Thioredoxin superfamily protein [Perilla frutescens var. frutescens]KAH6791908.1 Thioredoxin superfamily protein [Perilla frutescens var. hirtella]